jgi:hypothetical protein
MEVAAETEAETVAMVNDENNEKLRKRWKQ